MRSNSFISFSQLELPEIDSIIRDRTELEGNAVTNDCKNHFGKYPSSDSIQ